MEKSVVLCPDCRRIIAVGASLPATCLAAIPEADRKRLPASTLSRHPGAHNGCIEVVVDVPENLEGQALLDAVSAAHGATFASLVDGQLVKPIGQERP
jgi:hypothetical protein